VDVQARDVEAAAERVLERPAGGVGREAELRAVVAGPDRLVGVGLDPERDTEEDMPDTGPRRPPRRLPVKVTAGCRGITRWFTVRNLLDSLSYLSRISDNEGTTITFSA